MVFALVPIEKKVCAHLQFGKFRRYTLDVRALRHANNYFLTINMLNNNSLEVSILSCVNPKAGSSQYPLSSCTVEELLTALQILSKTSDIDVRLRLINFKYNTFAASTLYSSQILLEGEPLEFWLNLLPKVRHELWPHQYDAHGNSLGDCKELCEEGMLHQLIWTAGTAAAAAVKIMKQ